MVQDQFSILVTFLLSDIGTFFVEQRIDEAYPMQFIMKTMGIKGIKKQAGMIKRDTAVGL